MNGCTWFSKDIFNFRFYLIFYNIFLTSCKFKGFRFNLFHIWNKVSYILALPTIESICWRYFQFSPLFHPVTNTCPVCRLRGTSPWPRPACCRWSRAGRCGPGGTGRAVPRGTAQTRNYKGQMSCYVIWCHVMSCDVMLYREIIIISKYTNFIWIIHRNKI